MDDDENAFVLDISVGVLWGMISRRSTSLIPRLCVFGMVNRGHIILYFAKKGSTMSSGENGGVSEEHLVNIILQTSMGNIVSDPSWRVCVCVFRNEDACLVAAIRHLIWTRISFVV